MLQVVGITEPIKEKVEIDFHVPFTVRLKSIPPFENLPFYFFTGRFLEIVLNPITKEISRIILLNVTKVYFNKKPVLYNICKKVEEGIPIINTDQWGDESYLNDHEEHNFEVYFETDCITLIFLPYHEMTYKIINNRIAFGVDKDNYLCSIEIDKVSQEEHALLKESLQAKLAKNHLKLE